MKEELNKNQGTNLAELANKLAEAKQAIPKSKEKLKDKKKSSENYFITKIGTVTERRRNN